MRTFAVIADIFLRPLAAGKASRVLKLLPVALFLSLAAEAAQNQNDSTYLGSSSNPHPYSQGGVTPAVNNMPSQRTISGNSAQGNYMNGAYPYMDPMAGPGMERNNQPDISGQPAWLGEPYYYQGDSMLLPFGARLFQGHFAGTYNDNLNPDYLISPGDRVVLRIWGAKRYDDVLAVDQLGNIFIPDVGPVQVGGIRNSSLAATVKRKVAQIFTSNVEIYVNLQSAQPIGVYVTGFVNRPGMYAGGTYDSVLAFLDRAGGISYDRGSFRKIEIRRANQTVSVIDLYDFILRGKIPAIRLYDGDVILVSPRSHAVKVYGMVKQQAAYEFNGTETGKALRTLAAPLSSVTHASVTGTRNNVPFNRYLNLAEFDNFKLQDGDTVEFTADQTGKTILVSASGAICGSSRFPVGKSVRLRTLLGYVEVNPELADISSVYIKRRSVALQQRNTIAESLRRLEQSALTATSGSVDEAEIRVQEATLIQNFVQRASEYQPDGIMVVSRGGVVRDILLEDGDEIVVPQKSDVVLVSGEVMMPKAVTFDQSMRLDDYLAAAGGVSNRADESHILVAKANGEVGLADDLGIGGGDQILVIPKFDTKYMQFAKDIMQIIYQMAVATKVIVDL